MILPEFFPCSSHCVFFLFLQLTGLREVVFVQTFLEFMYRIHLPQHQVTNVFIILLLMPAVKTYRTRVAFQNEFFSIG